MSEMRVGSTLLEMIRGDITHQRVDAIVNAANSGLRGGGGVDGAIHRAGGPAIMEECRRIGGCAVGSAVITGAGALTARFVIHAVAPVYADGRGEEDRLLRDAYQSCLDLATDRQLRSIAFPALGTGAYRYPMRQAAEIALATIIAHLRGPTSLEHVIFVLFDDRALLLHEQVARSMLAT